jgi:hypothetical protein
MKFAVALVALVACASAVKLEVNPHALEQTKTKTMILTPDEHYNLEDEADHMRLVNTVNGNAKST